MNTFKVSTIRLLGLFLSVTVLAEAKPKIVFNPKDYPQEQFQVSQSEHSHGSVTIKLIQVKRKENVANSAPLICRAWLEILKNGKNIKEIYYADIEPLGFHYGLYVPKTQPSSKYFIIVKSGDYDGRVFLIDGEGKLLNLPGGRFFVDSKSSTLFTEYATDGGGLTIFDLGSGKSLFRWTASEVEMEFPDVLQWYKKDDSFFFTEVEWVGNPLWRTEKSGAVTIFDRASRQLVQKKITPDFIKSSQKIEYDFDFNGYPDCYCAQTKVGRKEADTSINGIFLHDGKSLEKTIPSIRDLKLIDSDLPYLHFCNHDCSQILVLVFHPGGLVHEVAEIEVQKNKNGIKEKNTPILKEVNNFITGKGIQLGMSRKELTSVLGKPMEISEKSGIFTLQYQINDPDSAFLKKYDMPLYYGHYVFENGHLIKFSFGFEYP